MLEIGSGLGGLTEALAELGDEIVAVEIDKGLVAALREVVGGRRNVKLVEADALAADLADLCGNEPGEWALAGNLPYNAATAIIMRALELRPPLQRIVCMVQREVGQRLLAEPGSEAYGSLSVAAAYHTESRAVAFRVPRGAFHPQPNVDSSVIAMRPRQAPRADVLDEALLLAIIRAGFGKRRKMLANALSSAPEWLDVSREPAAEALRACGLNEKARAEELGLEEFIALANELAKSGVRPSVPA